MVTIVSGSRKGFHLWIESGYLRELEVMEGQRVITRNGVGYETTNTQKYGFEGRIIKIAGEIIRVKIIKHNTSGFIANEHNILIKDCIPLSETDVPYEVPIPIEPEKLLKKSTSSSLSIEPEFEVSIASPESISFIFNLDKCLDIDD